MNDKILVVTQPDDILLQGVRIAHVDLTDEQGSVVSAGLLTANISSNVINYVWKSGNSVEWLLDKLLKSDLILFNADSSNQTLVGWLAAQPNSFYFGNLKDLYLSNDRAIYNADGISTSLEKIAKNYEQI